MNELLYAFGVACQFTQHTHTHTHDLFIFRRKLCDRFHYLFDAIFGSSFPSE